MMGIERTFNKSVYFTTEEEYELEVTLPESSEEVSNLVAQVSEALNAEDSCLALSISEQGWATIAEVIASSLDVQLISP